MRNKFIIICVLVAAVFVMSSCEKEEKINDNQYSSLNSASGEDLFRSIILRNGKFSKEIPFITQNKTKKSSPELIEFENNLIAYIYKEKPNFFTNLKMEFSSKDPARILDFLEVTGDIVNIYYSSLQETQNLISGKNESLSALDAEIGVAVAVQAPPPPNQFLSILVAYNFNSSPTIDSEINSRVRAEEFAIAIAKSF